MKDLGRSDAVLLALLSIIGRQVLRTKLVKMTYLLDNLSFEQRGHTMTGFTYHWDHFGPNAVGNAIMHRLSVLCSKGMVRDTQKLTPFENYANYYKIDGKVDPANLSLTSDDWVYIHTIVRLYGPLSRQQVVSASKQTAPVQKADQYDILKFEHNPAVESTKHAFFENEHLVHQTKKAIETDSSDRISLEELRDKVAESSRIQ